MISIPPCALPTNNCKFKILLRKDPKTLKLRPFTFMQVPVRIHDTPIEDEPFISEVFDSKYDVYNFAQFRTLSLETSLRIFDELVMKNIFLFLHHEMMSVQKQKGVFY